MAGGARSDAGFGWERKTSDYDSSTHDPYVRRKHFAVLPWAVRNLYTHQATFSHHELWIASCCRDWLGLELNSADLGPLRTSLNISERLVSLSLSLCPVWWSWALSWSTCVLMYFSRQDYPCGQQLRVRSPFPTGTFSQPASQSARLCRPSLGRFWRRAGWTLMHSISLRTCYIWEECSGLLTT